MMTKLTNAGFNGNSTVNGTPAITSNLNLATGETKVYTGTGTDSNYNVPIYYTLKVTNDGTNLNFVYTVSYVNPATSTLGIFQECLLDILSIIQEHQHKRCLL